MRPHRRQPTRLPHLWDSPGKNTGVGCHFLPQCMKVKVKVKLLSRVRPSATPWTAAYQAPPSTGFSRQEYWSGVPLPSLYRNWTTEMALYRNGTIVHPIFQVSNLRVISDSSIFLTSCTQGLPRDRKKLGGDE